MADIDNFFHEHTYLSDFFVSTSQRLLSNETVTALWISVKKNKMQELKTLNILKSGVREYINGEKNGAKYWELFKR